MARPSKLPTIVPMPTAAERRATRWERLGRLLHEMGDLFLLEGQDVRDAALNTAPKTRWGTPDEAAREWGVSAVTVRRYAKAGDIRAHQLCGPRWQVDLDSPRQSSENARHDQAG